jgi:outer membrane lipase/esterase
MHATYRFHGGLICSLLLLPVLAIAGNPHQDRFDRIVGFGDSLSDPGNLYSLFGQTSTAPYDPVPSAPYEIGGNRFSDGPIWLEQLAVGLKDPLDGKPAFRNGALFANYAVGGARARAAGDAPNQSAQIAAFLANNAGAPLGGDLFVLWFGANDVRDALTALSAAATPQELAAAYSIIPQALANTAINIQALYAAGGRSFLVPSVPNLAITPAIRSLGPDAVAAAAYLSATYRIELDSALDALAYALPGAAFIRLDVWSLLTQVAAMPESYGLQNTTTPCLSFGVVAKTVCDEPDAYLFWDAIHPTHAAHRILANEALELINMN